MKKIGIIDYDMGNLHSVIGAFKHIGRETFTDNNADNLSKADALILPGVGAFPDAMENLAKYGLIDFIKSEALKKPLLGICLGMQLLFERSFEFRECQGLGLIKGEVIKLHAFKNDSRYKIPHMGWNKLDVKIKSPITDNLPESAYVYFVHSFKAVPCDNNNLYATVGYGEVISAVVGNGNVYGTQFHPEKSENTGLQILKNFGDMI